MFLKLDHQKLDIYIVSRAFVLECYKLSKRLPPEEKFGLVSQLRRAAVSIHLMLRKELHENPEMREEDIMKLPEGCNRDRRSARHCRRPWIHFYGRYSIFRRDVSALLQDLNGLILATNA